MKSSALIERLAGVENELDALVGSLSSGNRVALAKSLMAAKKKVQTVIAVVNEAITMDSQAELKLKE